ncbi:MAG: alpha-L-fucosidase [Cytophagales bacterium]|nr:alpha-L-fucosidase [Cytophagales bacterium]
MKHITKAIALLLLINLYIGCQPKKQEQALKSITSSDTDKMAWWHEARFGMFVHWGLYSVPAGIYNGEEIGGIGEWILRNAKIPIDTYRGYAGEFNPTEFNAEEWAALAKKAGMRYVVITSKHHDGFAMYPTKVSSWNIMDAAPYSKDIIGSVEKAFRAQGLKFGLYYSQAQDWFHPGGAIRRARPWDEAQKGNFDTYLSKIALPQATEILETYRPDILWWDTPDQMTEERIQPFLKLVEKYPRLITNNRLAHSKAYGDFSTPEQHIPATGMDTNFEVCMTLNDTWGYKSYDNNWKSSEELIAKLVDIASKGGNFLLNVGPDKTGKIPQATVERLNEVGDWMQVNSESIYGTTASKFAWLPWGRTTTKAGKKSSVIYLHVFDWPEDGKLVLPGLEKEVLSAELLKDRQKIAFTKEAKGNYVFSVPTEAPTKAVSVVKVTIKGAPKVGYLYPQQKENGNVEILANQLMIHNKSYNAWQQMKLEKIEGIDVIRNWHMKRDYIEAIFKISKPGTYEVAFTCKVEKETMLQMTVDKDESKEIRLGTSKAMQSQKLHTITFDNAGEHRIIYKLKDDGAPVELSKMVMKPVL